MPYAWIVASCNVGCLLSDCSLDLAFPISGCLCLFSLFLRLFFDPLNISLISRVPSHELWDSLSSLVNPGIACLASLSSDWPDALWASLSGV